MGEKAGRRGVGGRAERRANEKPTERLGERARSKSVNGTYVKAARAGYIRDEGDKSGKVNPGIPLRHSGHDQVVIRNPVALK